MINIHEEAKRILMLVKQLKEGSADEELQMQIIERALIRAINTSPDDHLMIELGNNDKLVSDIYDDENNEWAGIAISDSDGHVVIGGIVETGADRVGDLNPIVTIVTKNKDSLGVIIQACNRAIKKLEQQP